MPPMSGLRQYSAAGRLRPSPAGPSPGRWPSPTGRGDAWIERDDLLVGQRQPQPTRFELDARQPRDAQHVNDRLTLPVLAQGRQVMARDGRRRHGAAPQCDQALSPGSLSGLGIVGCETASAVHFLPAFCPIAGLWACKSGKNCPRWGRFSLSTPQVRQAPSTAANRDNAKLAAAAPVNIGVAVMPGHSAVTVTPLPAHSSASDSVSDST